MNTFLAVGLACLAWMAIFLLIAAGSALVSLVPSRRAAAIEIMEASLGGALIYGAGVAPLALVAVILALAGPL